LLKTPSRAKFDQLQHKAAQKIAGMGDYVFSMMQIKNKKFYI